MTAQVVLNRKRKKRLESGHPWIYQSEVDRLEGEVEPGDIVQVVNHQGLYLATAYINPNSQIVARILTYQKDESIDARFFEQRIRRAWAFRERFLPGIQSCRVIYGEADFLPGMVVDKYADVLVVQILTAGMESLKPHILDALLAVFDPQGIYLRNDVGVRYLEGLTQESEVWFGTVPHEIEMVENGLRFLVDVYEGQKTGYFFDQRENRAAIKPLLQAPPAGGADVLECFCHTGSFTVNALQYGARRVTAVDISEHAIEVAQKNVELNGFSDRVEFHVANAFDFLRDEEKNRRQYDVVVLDPPAFAKSRKALEGAIRGYKEINLRGMKLVRDGGFLVTASCSYHMSPELFQETILDAAFDAHKILRLVHWSGAGKDHPEIAGVTEGHYLKFAIYEVNSR